MYQYINGKIRYQKDTDIKKFLQHTILCKGKIN